MVFFKALGALVLTGVGVCGAILLNRRAAESIDRLEAWIALLRLTKNQIDCFSLPLSDILRRCEPSLLTRIGWQEKTPPKDFGTLGETARDGVLTEEGERVAVSFCEEIGKGYRGEQLRACDYSIGLFTAERDRLLSELPKRRQRNVTLSLAAALSAVVLLL